MTRKELVYKLGEKEYTLKFSMRVPLLFERQTGRSYFEVFGSGKTPSLTDILTLVWAVFKNGGAPFTLDELADRLDNAALQDLAGKVTQLVADNTSAAPAQGQAEGALPLA